MEKLNTLYNLMGLVFVLSTIVLMGLSLTEEQITGPMGYFKFVIVGLVADFVIHPFRFHPRPNLLFG